MTEPQVIILAGMIVFGAITGYRMLRNDEAKQSLKHRQWLENRRRYELNVGSKWQG